VKLLCLLAALLYVCIYSTPNTDIYIVTGFHVRDIPAGYPHTHIKTGMPRVRRPLEQPDFPLSLVCCSSYVAATDAAAAAAHYTD
jgi:hypothetical protein